MTVDLNNEKSKKIIDWTENLMKCFNEVKKMFTQAPFSKQAVAAILSQEQHGAERFLGVKGRKC